MPFSSCVSRPCTGSLLSLPYANSQPQAVPCKVAVRSACRPQTVKQRSTPSFKPAAKQRSGRFGARACFASAKTAFAAQVVLTREAGKNGKLEKALKSQGISSFELPLVETSPGPQRAELASHLKSNDYDWVVITSPEAANVFLQGWAEADRPQVRIAVVGQGTADVMQAHQETRLQIEHTPTKANAVSLSAELPHVPGGTERVLYPSSAKAGSDLQTGLTQRGFDVVRLNTYDTQPVSHISDAQLMQACQADVVSFASPSAIKAWRKLINDQDVGDSVIACIGSTTAIAAEKQGFSHVYFPEQPGIGGFVTAIKDALAFASKRQAIQAA